MSLYQQFMFQFRYFKQKYLLFIAYFKQVSIYRVLSKFLNAWVLDDRIFPSFWADNSVRNCIHLL